MKIPEIIKLSFHPESVKCPVSVFTGKTMKNDENKNQPYCHLAETRQSLFASPRASEPVQRLSGRKSENSDQNHA